MERTESSNAGRRRLVTIAVVAAVLLVGGIGVAVAQTSGSSTTTPSPSATGPGRQGPHAPGGPKGRFRGGPGGPGFGGGPGGAIHGEFVQPDGSGGYRTVDQQVGDVTEVSSSSISVKSADGFSKTYSVDENTVVNSGRDGISNVKNGDKVAVNAVVNDGKAAARSIQDLTTLGQIRQHWNPNAPNPQGGPPTTKIQ
jgi:hypothetical protein